MLGQSNEFYHGLTKKYTAIFGTLFNNLYVSRLNQDGSKASDFKVPLEYSSREKYLSKITEDAGKKTRATALQLPKMAYQLLSYDHDPSRSLNPMGNLKEYSTTWKSTYNATPYNMTFALYITAKTLEEGARVLEQILPHFKPELILSANLLDEFPNTNFYVPITLKSVSLDDSFEGMIDERRILTWTLIFTVKAQFFGLIQTPKVIKFAKVNLYPTSASNTYNEYTEIDTYPGMDANGNPTTDPTLTIPWQNIEVSDTWDYIITIEDKTANT